MNYEQKIKTMVDDKPQYEFAIKQFARLLTDRDALQALVDEQGFTYRAGDLIKPNPAVGQLREVQKQLLTFYSRFGLTSRDERLLEKEQEEDTDLSEFSDLE
ncbi:P27 family phage terminase small subunit [Novacetimonas hansenii]|uniref:Terminase small subunit n=1 Tax=Novacetimonas hansenii TaxID=436 RepID=A0ABQ0SH44_NOVHA|nr:P27 family phage terminase small subunit [Novacetimonas hansenii]GAN84014.1 hypothetical protein Gaha_0122_014 [Novacetimonas hansenii JCM 7643]GBQ55758.1 hypothetical protein AA0243_1002 [Novacetimonas hansenii NRIC 0243]GEC64594.1 hypothetical protein GHA01_24430 [Novacetimonas hansenii]